MIHLHEVRDQDTHYRINPVTMEIEDNGSGKNELNLGDHNSEIYTFELPRVIEGHDMTLCNLVQVHFINIGTTDKSKDVYTIIDMEPAADDADTLVFSWPVSGSATMYSGNLNYRIKFACLDESGNYTYRKWTDIYKGITVGDGFDNGEGLEYTYSDILAQWEARLDALEQNGGGGGGTGIFYVDLETDSSLGYAIVQTEYDAIVDAYNNDKLLVCRIKTDNEVYFGRLCVYYVYDDRCYFTFKFDGYEYCVTDSGVATLDPSELEREVEDLSSTVEDLSITVGNISTALDHIIEIQEELIGT